MTSSRGARHSINTSAILKLSMRDNYNQYGVEHYYQKVSQTYRNPHLPGIASTLRKLFISWLAHESPRSRWEDVIVFDMACGSGEASIVYAEWCARNELVPKICASDPYTAPAYRERTLHTCSVLSFRDIANGQFPTLSRRVTPTEADPCPDIEVPVVELTVCSFALHLVEDKSDLFALLWRLSTRSKWLIVLAPHKKPTINAGWGWTKWAIEKWAPCSMNGQDGELLNDRVHCRLYKSLNI